MVRNKLVQTSAGCASTFGKNHSTYSFPWGPSSLSILKSPNFTRWCSSRARQPKNMVLLNQMVRWRLWGGGLPTVLLSATVEFHLQSIQRLCLAFDLCQRDGAAFVWTIKLLWPWRTVCLWVYCIVFLVHAKKRSILLNSDVSVLGSKSSAFCLRTFKTKWAKSLSSSCGWILSSCLVPFTVFAHL